MITKIKSAFSRMWKGLDDLFAGSNYFRLGLYGAPNTGKTTLANRICKDLLNVDDEFTGISNIAHETRKITLKEKIVMNKNGRKILFDLVDTPGIATRVDYEVFTKAGMSAKDAKQRAREATKGVIESIKWLDNVDMVVIMIDATKNPYNQVNLTIVGNLEARKIPFILVANKTDLKNGKLEKIQQAFPKYKVVGVSAKFSQNLDKLYDELLVMKKKIRKR